MAIKQTKIANKANELLELLDGNEALAVEAIKDRHDDQTNRLKSAPHSSSRLGAKLITAHNLAMTYRLGKQTITALNDVSIDVAEGEFIAITGASGSGKSTLLQLVGGLDKPTSGQITIDGHDLSTLKDEALAEFRNQTIGFVFQFFYLQPFLSLSKNIEVPGMFGCTKPQERSSRVAELLETVGLAEQARQFPKQLSGGQTQRAAIARALLNQPKILLADEPTGNLDSKNSAGIIDLFKRIRDTAGTTIVIVTHNPEIAAQADREIRLSDGVIV